jgi:hypothetical protein
MIIACLALLVALAGTSVAAVQAVIPRNSIGALQLKSNSVGGLELKPNSVNSSKVLNHSLLKTDFKAGQIPAGPRGLPGPAGPTGPAGPAGPAGAAGTSGVAAPGYVAQVLTVTGTKDDQTNSTSFTPIDAAKVDVTVPANETDKLLVFFNAETACFGSAAGAHCLVRITVDNNEIDPATGSDATFDSNGPTGSEHTANTQAQHAIVRISPTLSAGAHTVRVEVSTTNSGATLRYDDWTLAVERVRVT